jgi:hypothetical protein
VKRSYEDLKERSRQRVVEKLRLVIAAYDGTARSAREILRGLVAASDLQVDVSPFIRELGRKTRHVHDVNAPKGSKLAG